MFRMSTLGMSLATCLELSARLELVWLQGPAKFQSESGVAMFFAGVDVAKRRHELCVIDLAGDVVLNLSVENSHKGLNKLLAAFETKQLTNQNTRFCLEATGHYWIALYCQLQEHGFSIDVVNPIQSDALRNLYIRKAKTDQKDSFILADLLRLGRAGSTQLASETILQLQSLSRLRFEFVRQIGGLKNKVLAILDRIFPEYPECFSNVFIKTSRELLKEFSSPEDLADVDLMELTAFLQEHSRGRLGIERAERIQKLAKGTFGVSIAMDAFTLELRLLLQQIEFIEEQITEIEEAIDQVMEQMRPSDTTAYRHVIETIPGIGPVLAAAILGEIGDIHRFQNAKSLVAFAGIDATVRSSGQFEGTRNRMSKRGSPVLRHSLWMAAVSARRFNPEYKEYYDNKRAEGKHSSVVTGAIARKLTHLIHALWTAERPFDPDYRWEPPSANENVE